MKRKYYKYTKKYIENLVLVHTYSDSVKENSYETYLWECYRKDKDCAKKLYHYKYNVVLEDSLDVRRARRIIYNPKLFEKNFNDWCYRLNLKLAMENKKKEIANHFCNMSFDEVLKLPDPKGYEFIDEIYDQIVESRN